MSAALHTGVVVHDDCVCMAVSIYSCVCMAPRVCEGEHVIVCDCMCMSVWLSVTVCMSVCCVWLGVDKCVTGCA